MKCSLCKEETDIVESWRTRITFLLTSGGVQRGTNLQFCTKCFDEISKKDMVKVFQNVKAKLLWELRTK